MLQIGVNLGGVCKFKWILEWGSNLLGVCKIKWVYSYLEYANLYDFYNDDVIYVEYANLNGFYNEEVIFMEYANLNGFTATLSGQIYTGFRVRKWFTWSMQI